MFLKEVALNIDHTQPLMNQSKTEPRLRMMSQSDVPNLYEMYLDYPLMIANPRQFGIDWLYEVVDDANQWRFTIVDGHNTILGAATLWWSHRDTQIISPTMWVDKACQRTGVAHKVMGELAKIAWED